MSSELKTCALWCNPLGVCKRQVTNRGKLVVMIFEIKTSWEKAICLLSGLGGGSGGIVCNQLIACFIVVSR